MAERRLTRDYTDLAQKNPMPGCTVTLVNDNLFLWHLVLEGPADTPYQGGRFILKAEFPPDYPFKPYKLSFVTRIYHVNVDDKGLVCLGTLKDENWKPTLTVRDGLAELFSLLSAPNLEAPIRNDLADLYRTNPAKYNENARKETKDYAKAS